MAQAAAVRTKINTEITQPGPRPRFQKAQGTPGRAGRRSEHGTTWPAECLRLSADGAWPAVDVHCGFQRPGS
jgi:hypothetical protein